MRQLLVLAAVFAAAAAFSAEHSAGSAQIPQVEGGRALYTTYCASCHGTSGRGDGPVAAQLVTKPANLAEFAVHNGGVFPAERLHRIIDGQEMNARAHGSMEMPVWGDAFRRREGLSEEAASARIDAIIQYLRVIQERRAH